MGRMALIIVMGLAITVAYIGFSLNQSKTGTVENVSGFHKYTTARNIAHTAVNMALRALDRNDSVFISTRTLKLNTMGGRATVTFVYPNPASLDTIELTAKAQYMDSSKIMNLRLRRTPVPFPTLGAAVGLRAPDVNFQIDGSAANIDGRNHDINGNVLAPSSDDKPGVSVLTPTDTTKVQTEEAVLPGEQILGTEDVVVDSNMADPSLFVNEYINAADRVFTTGTYGSSMTWGSVDAPWIVFCNGDVKFTGNISGYGILVVKGNLTVSGGFTFRGLVIAYNDVTIEQFSMSTGTPLIVGGLLMSGGAGSKFELKGNDQISYSREALAMAQFINKLQVYRVMRWYE